MNIYDTNDLSLNLINMKDSTVKSTEVIDINKSDDQ